MQVNAATDYVVRIGWMDHDRIAIRNLAFTLEMSPVNVLPARTAIGSAKDAQQEILVATGFVFRKRVKDVRFRRANGQCRATEERRVGKPVG